MTIRKRTASITCNAFGQGTADVLVSSFDPSRFAALFGVEVLSEGNTNSKRIHVDIYEVKDYDAADDTADVYGPLVFHLFDPRPDFTYQPRVETHKDSVDQAASTAGTTGSTAEENGPLRIHGRSLRVDITGASAAATLDVDLLIQSAGDQRF